MKFRKISLFVLLASACLNVSAQNNVSPQKMDWFEDAKLGIFIHWGIYSVDGISESWSFFNNYINHDNYIKQLNGFTAKDYRPKEWAKLIKEAGAKYTVITTKHHDGISMWNTKADKAITTLQDAAAKQDVITPFVKAIQEEGLHTGLYYSLPDWSHPYYDVFTRNRKRYELKSEPSRWDNYVKYYQKQLTELSEQYKPELLWFDGDWEHSAEEWKAKETLNLLRKYNPNIIINSRLNHHGDYDTPEQGIPVTRPDAKFWELCYTMNDSWGYQPFDKKYKSPNMIIRTLVDCISMGGNLLLDIGPKADGTIPEEQLNILKQLGRWTHKHAAAIYGTRAGIPFVNYGGKSALSKDGKTLYLYVYEQKPELQLRGLVNHTAIKEVSVVGDASAKVNVKSENGTVQVDLTKVNFDQDVTVIALTFAEVLRWTAPQDTEVTLKSVLDNKLTGRALGQIASTLHAGKNIFDNSGLTVDGLETKLPSSNATNPTVLKWIKDHAEALYETGKGLPEGHYEGLSALSKDRQTLYLFVEGKPTGPIALKGVKNGVARIRVVGEGSMINHEIFNKLYWSSIPGIIYIQAPAERLDKNMTVIAVLLDAPIQLYREKVGAIENNL
ncbi:MULTISPECIES: alpha-L-fucosidase [Sphingobacterium]|uniref:Alpha-L-fucosidase n=1 Tax=Sphingobacterium thalpophilum TaxID=259 RepID=A0ACD5C4S4_9SPHI|nr:MULTISPECIES: alpha-L-fucosidase [Sphingobacterium]OFV21631.1 alpha-L-fucosidase [Sphingobacterium sp. HMSC13C05]OJZ11242.1 MAG: alpha-L-fucosidase [Sphingobacterium sp. 40-24]HAF33356.1 alpha-L-fucosidase [Sphingobacterium sp.]